MTVRVADVMSRAPVKVSSEVTARDAAWVALEHGVDHLLVEDGERVGIVCATCDLRRWRDDDPRQASERRGGARPVAHATHWRVVTVSPDASVTDALARSYAHRVGALVVRRASPGIVTRGDLLRAGATAEGSVRRRFSCAACGGHAHLVDTGGDDVCFCVDCLERGHSPHYDLGGEG